MIDVIYLAGGSGVRADLGYPKQFARLGGKPILIFGIETLGRNKEIDKIIIPGNDIEQIEDMLECYCFDKTTIIIEKGETRQKSVYNALKYIETEYVLIMEAVRPFISDKLLTKVIKVSGDIVVPRSIMYSTVVIDNGKIIDREICGEVQMPQKYKTSFLIDNHEKAIEDKLFLFSDDLALIMYYNNLCIPKIIKGEQQNIKITTPLDLKIAEGIYEYNNNRE